MDRGRTRSIVNDPQIAKSITVGKCTFFLPIDLDLANSFKDDIIGSAFIILLKDVVVFAGSARSHLFKEILNFLVTTLRKDEVLAEGLFNFCNIVR